MDFSDTVQVCYLITVLQHIAYAFTIIHELLAVDVPFSFYILLLKT